MSRLLGHCCASLPQPPSNTSSTLYLLACRRLATVAAATSKCSRPTQDQEPRPFSEVPGPKPSIPIIGTSWLYFKFVGRYQLFKMHEASLDKYNRYGPIAKEEFEYGKPVVHLFDPSDFERVFRNQGKYPNRPPNEFVCHYRRKHPNKYPTVGMAHLLGEEWYRERQLLAPALLKLDIIRNHVQSQSQISDDLVTYMSSIGQPVPNEVDRFEIEDLQSVTYRLALESVSSMCLDTRLGCLSISTPQDGLTLISATKLLFEAYQELYYSPPLWRLFETKSYRKLAQAEETIYQITSRYIEAELSRHSANRHYRKPAESSIQHSSPSSPLSNSMNSCTNAQPVERDDSLKKDPALPTGSNSNSSVLKALLDRPDMDDRHAKIAILDFIAGGIFTVSNSLAYLLYHLASNQDAQERLYRELISVLERPEAPITDQHLQRLDYLKACTKESFRLTSTVPAIVRVLPVDTVLSGYSIPAGTTVFSHFHVTCQLEKYFERSEQFLPERWLRGGSSQPSPTADPGQTPVTSVGHSQHPFALLPFGFGSRMCAGRRFSELELYMATAKVILNYRLSTVAAETHNRKLERTHAFILIPELPIRIECQRRS